MQTSIWKLSAARIVDEHHVHAVPFLRLMHENNNTFKLDKFQWFVTWNNLDQTVFMRASGVNVLGSVANCKH